MTNRANDQLSAGQTVIARIGDEAYPGIIVEVNDPDQGDFEYYVDHEDGGGSYWPRECLTPIPNEQGEQERMPRDHDNTRYQQELSDAKESGFVVGATLRHYKDPTNGTYKLLGYYMVTDNSPYDGGLGILYQDVMTTQAFGRPYQQMVQDMPYGEEDEEEGFSTIQRFQTDVIVLRVPKPIIQQLDRLIRPGAAARREDVESLREWWQAMKLQPLEEERAYEYPPQKLKKTKAKKR
jgi:hypothetical protein